MKYFAFLCLLSVTLAAEEPEPINHEEMHDEVAKAQMRATWIACLSIASEKLEKIQDKIHEIHSKSSHSHELIVKKLAADILSVCEDKITWQVAEEILSESQGETIEKFMREVSEVNFEQFSQPSVGFTDRQKELIKNIEEEMNRHDDGFDQAPPVVQEIIDSQTEMQKFYIVFAGASVVCIWVLWKLCQSGTEEPQRTTKDLKKKKRE